MQLSFGSNPNMAPGQVSFGNDAVDTDANVQPSTTTIRTNTDGSRDITHKTSYTADQTPPSGFNFNSSYNNTALAAPVAPVAPQQGQLGSGTGMGIMPETTPAAAPAPVQTFGQVAQPPVQSIPQVPQPGPGVQVAGPMVPGVVGAAPQPPAAARPVAPAPLAPPAAGASAEGTAGEAEAQAAQQRGQANPYAIMQNDPVVSDQVRQQHMDILNNNADIRVAAAKSGDTNLPIDVRHMFAMQTADLSRYNMEEQKAKAKVATMSTAEIAKTLQKNNPEGSWTRYLITGILGLTGLNQMEANKLGLGDKTMPVRDPQTGASGMIRVSPNGTPTMGINSNGTVMSHEELTNFYAQAAQKKVAAATTSTQDVENKEGVKGRVVTEHLPDGRTKTYVESGGKQYDYTSAWKPVAIGTAQAKAEIVTAETPKREEAKQGVKLKYAGPIAATTASAREVGEFNAKNGTNLGFKVYGTGDNKHTVLVDKSTGRQVDPNNISAPAAVTLPPGAPPAVAAPVISADNRGILPPPVKYPELGDRRPDGTVISNPATLAAARKDYEEKQKVGLAGQTKVAEVAAKDITEKLNLAQQLQSDVALAKDAIDTNKVYLGGGANTAIRAYYHLNPLATQPEEMVNTNRIMTLTKEENLKTLASMIKGSFSDKDMAYINRHTITENTDPKEIRKWLDHYEQATIKAYNNQASAFNNPTAAAPVLNMAPKVIKLD